MMLTVDDTTARMIELLRERLAEEPEVPDLDRHIGTHLEIVARRYNEWERQCGGFRVLIGARLVRLAVEGEP